MSNLARIWRAFSFSTPWINWQKLMRTRRVYAFLFHIPEAAEVISHAICKTTNVFFFLKLIPNFNGKRRKMQHWLLQINLHPCLWAYFAVNGSYDANRLTESVKKQIHGCCCGAFIAIVIHMKTEMKTWLTSHLSLPNDISRKEL